MKDPGKLRAEVVRRYVQRLEASCSPLVADPSVRRQTVEGAEVILSAVFPGGVNDEVAGSAPPTEVIGKARARQQIHPSFSLTAASVLFETGLSAIREEATRPNDAGKALEMASQLESAIMERIIPASLQYVDVLLEKVDRANRHERLSVSRHLHDNVAHGIAAAIQRLQLCRKRDHELAQDGDELFTQALTVLRQTLGSVRDVATTLRNVVGERSLDVALGELLEDSVGYSGQIELLTAGPVGSLTPHLKEELFIILREGIRNAFQHATGMTELKVGVEVSPSAIRAYVEDNGEGLSAARPSAYSHIGLRSMEERTELLGGAWDMHSVAKVGCRVSIRIPAVDGQPVVFP